MSQQNVAVIGASADRAKYGNAAVRAYRARGWEVFPVNSRGGEIEGLRVYRSVRDVPRPLARVLLYLPPAAGLLVLPEIAEVGPQELVVNPGAESAELLRAARGLGLAPLLTCGIVAIGESPSTYLRAAPDR
jgi:uncharacterized protein